MAKGASVSLGIDQVEDSFRGSAILITLNKTCITTSDLEGGYPTQISWKYVLNTLLIFSLLDERDHSKNCDEQRSSRRSFTSQQLCCTLKSCNPATNWTKKRFLRQVACPRTGTFSVAWREKSVKMNSARSEQQINRFGLSLPTEVTSN